MLLRDDLRQACTRLWQWRYILGVFLAAIFLGIMAFVFLEVPNVVPIWVGVLSALGMMIGNAMLVYAMSLDKCLDAVRTSYEKDNGPRVAKLGHLMALFSSVGLVMVYLSLMWLLVAERPPFQPVWVPLLVVIVVVNFAAGPLLRFAYYRRRAALEKDETDGDRST